MTMKPYRFLFIALISASVTGADRSGTLVSGRLDPRFGRLLETADPRILKEERARLPVFMGQNRDGEDLYAATVYSDDPESLSRLPIRINAVYAHFATALVTRSGLKSLAAHPSVRYVDAGSDYHPANDVAAGLTGAKTLQAGYLNNTTYTGKNVLLCIYDTGIDWAHEDFRDPDSPGSSRILFLWDQRNSPDEPGETSPVGFGYGIEYTAAHIENEIDGTPAGFVESTDPLGHGTHVAGTAAGNGSALASRKYAGLAPEADLIIIKGDDANGGFNSTLIADGLDYARQKAEALGMPMVVNLSLGTDSGPHDGTDAISEAIDIFTSSGPGRVVVASAGNNGENPIHVTGTVASGSSVDIVLTVPSYTAAPGARNDDFNFEAWFNNNGSVNAVLISPNGYMLEQGPGGYYEQNTPDGTQFVYNAVDAANNDRKIRVEADDASEAIPPAAGTWTLRLTNQSGSAMTYHGWLYDRSIGNASVVLTNGNTEYCLSNTASGSLIVGCYAHRWRWMSNAGSFYSGGTPNRSDDVSSFSSRGPTRDARQKPDLAAPGERIGSSLSQYASPASSVILPGARHFLNQGTSMSAAVAAGAAALILEQDPSLSAAQVLNDMISGTVKDEFTGGTWQETWGNGKLSVLKAMALTVDPASLLEQEIPAYDDWGGTEYSQTLAAGQKAAVRFTAGISGQAAGVFIHLANATLTGSVKVEICMNSGGLPGAVIGSTASCPAGNLLKNSWNFIDLSDAHAEVESGSDYHAVVYHDGSSGETMSLLMEQIIPVDGRSFLNNSGTWLSHTYDLRVRPMLCSLEDIRLRARIFLEGPYSASTHLMATTLRSAGFLPLASPYAQDARNVAAVPANVVDWVLLQLRETAGGAAVHSRSAWLRNDGRIVGDDGLTETVVFPAMAGSYFITVSHRNHLSVMSRLPVELKSTSVSYDFTTGSAQFYGSGGARELEVGVWGMWAGDADGSGQVGASDRNETWNKRTQSGYLNADCDLSGYVLASDRNITWNNRTRTSQVP
ncbi:S8 family serine peptidase [bacterium]|nr:S8 family serine peptidase [bacterium]